MVATDEQVNTTVKIERQWLWNRLKAMSVQEIIHRCSRLVRYGYDSVAFRYGWVSKTCVNFEATGQTLFDCSGTMNLDSTSSALDTEQHRTLWLNNTVQLFNPHKQYSLGEPVQWRVDPETGTNTPATFGRSIDYRDDQTVGEIKYLWELGRHQFLVPMAIRVATDNDAQVRMQLEAHLSSWMQQNPIGIGIHWCSSLELSLRLISWSFIHAILQRGGLKNGLFDLNCDAQQLGIHIYSKVKFVVGNYSRYSSSNNHLIGELSGVWMACNVFDLGDKGRNWRDSALSQLHTEIQLQTHNDGVNKEQAIYYHLWSLEYFWLVWSVAKRFDHPVSAAFEEKLVAMIEFLKSMCRCTDMPSQIGDADGGVVARFNPDITENVFQSLLTAVTPVLANDASHLGKAADVYSKAYWYQMMVEQADVSSLAKIQNTRAADTNRPKVAFTEGGYYSFPGKESHLLFKAGPFGYLSTGAHGHADALSITLAIEGRWWLVDPGTYTYHSSGEWRNYFRSTAAHNTVCVNRSDQSEIAGDFLWSRQTDAKVTSVEYGDAGATLSSVTGSHAGYAEQGVEHERTVKSDAVRTFDIHDRITVLENAGECEMQLSFHFHPDIELTQLDTHRWRATRQNSVLSLTLELPEQFVWTVERGSESPIAGWYSETYGVKTPSHSLLGRVVLKAGAHSTTRLYCTSLLVHSPDTSGVNEIMSR